MRPTSFGRSSLPAALRARPEMTGPGYRLVRLPGTGNTVIPTGPATASDSSRLPVSGTDKISRLIGESSQPAKHSVSNWPPARP